MPWFEFALIGAVAGYLAGFLGIGGGLVIVPALTWIFLQTPDTADHAIHFAVATSLATMLVTSLSSIVAHHYKQAILWGTVRRLLAGLLIGAGAGAVLATSLSPGRLTLVFAVFALIAGLQLLFAPAIKGQKQLPGSVSSTLIGMMIGGISSLVGIGGGSITGPWLMWHGIRAQNAIATAAACGYPIAIAGTLAFIFLGMKPGSQSATPGMEILGYVHGPAWITVAVAGALAAPLGVATVHRLSPALVKRLFGIVLVAIALRLVLMA